MSGKVPITLDAKNLEKMKVIVFNSLLSHVEACIIFMCPVCQFLTACIIDNREIIGAEDQIPKDALNGSD